MVSRPKNQVNANIGEFCSIIFVCLFVCFFILWRPKLLGYILNSGICDFNKKAKFWFTWRTTNVLSTCKRKKKTNKQKIGRQVEF